jgi:hypothetical protein
MKSLARTPEELAAGIIASHGGPAMLTAAHHEIVLAMVRTFDAMRRCDPADLGGHADSLSKLEKLLPQVVTPALTAQQALSDYLATGAGEPAGASDDDGADLPTPEAPDTSPGRPAGAYDA